MIIVPAGNLYGRGASDNKAPVLAWIHAVEAYQALNMVRASSQYHSMGYFYHMMMNRTQRVRADAAEVL